MTTPAKQTTREKVQAAILAPSIIPMVRVPDRAVINDTDLKALRAQNKAVAIVGFSSRHRLLAPFDDPNIEIWGLNRLHQQDWFTRCDVMFQLHPIGYLQKSIGLSDGDREHYDWLCKEHDFPIYCQKKYPEFPASVEFPIRKMRLKYGDFYTSTAAYMIAKAIDDGFNHFELYGFDMEADTEYKYQRDSTEYFIGLADGMGFPVFIPQNCSLLKGELGMYGYETTEVGFRQLLEGRTIQLAVQMDGASAEYNRLAGRGRKLDELVSKYPDLLAQKDVTDLNLQNQGGLLNTISGAQTEVRECIKLFDQHYNNLGVEVSVGESGDKDDAETE